MRDLAVLFLHLIVTIVRLAGPGGARSVVAESVLLKQQLLILNRPWKRSPNLRVSDRIVAGLCALLMRHGRLIRSAIVLKPSTLLSLHRALKTGNIAYCSTHAFLDNFELWKFRSNRAFPSYVSDSTSR